ncbi:Non-cyanogenic beta-glucosidase [Vigna angularis]|uniref:Non-cyanogenic beta-glucosidase n=1 Tax=Phaseolus angularis TaxID=3914 RepID=A0A8T0JGB1_PHAAN|nr:Non-cyanogenic beta-glucosidase [Vigna angularis]
MAYNAFFLTVVAIVRTLASVTLAEPVPVAPILDVSFLNRSTFPPGFLFGTASAAYQSSCFHDLVYYWDLRFVEPLTSGKYPKSMRSLVGNRLPEFSQQQMKLVNGSFDFIGLNYYTSNYATHAPQLGTVKPNYNTDANTNLTIAERNGIPIGVDEFNDPTLSLEESLLDTLRIDYHYRHLFYLHSAISEIRNQLCGLQEWLEAISKTLCKMV